MRIATTPQMRDYLAQLVRTGLYGKNPTEAADRLLSEGVRRAMGDRVFRDLHESGHQRLGRR